MAHRIRWNDLQIILAVAEHRSLSGAARVIGVNHSTILRRIETLERQLDLVLFDRPPGGYRLKPEARELLASLRTIERTVGRVERALSAARRGIEGTVRITTTDSVAEVLLPRHLEALGTANPGVQVELLISNMPLDMSRPEAEITLRPARAMPDGLEGRKVGEMAFEIFASPGYLADNPSPDLAGHRWLGVAPPLTRAPVGLWQETRLTGPPVIVADSFLTLASLAERGLGLAMIPSFLGRSRAGLVRAAAFSDREVTSLWAAAHPELLALPHIAALVDFFAEALDGDRGLLV